MEFKAGDVKRVPVSQGRTVKLFHKTGSEHWFEPVDAKEILAHPEPEYAHDLGFFDKLKESVEQAVATVADVADQVNAVIDSVSDVAEAAEAVKDAVKDPKKKG